MDYLLYSDATSTTGKTLLEALKAAGVNISGGGKLPNGKIGTLVRWGSAQRLGQLGKPTKVVNKASAIQLASSKLEALKILKENDIRVPEVFASAASIKPEDFPVLGRKTHHVAGNDIVLCLQATDLKDAAKLGCTYFTKYIPTAIEYRVHIFDDAVIKISQKVLTQPELNKDPWIRNYDEGYTFHPATTKLSAGAKGMAMAAVGALGLTFGAVDIVIGDDGKAYVLEVNTGPGLQSDSSVDVYVQAIKKSLGNVV